MAKVQGSINAPLQGENIAAGDTASHSISTPHGRLNLSMKLSCSQFKGFDKNAATEKISRVISSLIDPNQWVSSRVGGDLLE